MLGIAGRDRLCLRPDRSVRESSCGDDCVSAHMRYDLGDEVQRENHQRSTAGRFCAYAGSEHVLVDGRHDATSMTEGSMGKFGASSFRAKFRAPLS
jgi:hypothetical protein